MADVVEARFLELVLRNPINAQILERTPALGLPDWYLVSGCLFQTVWNVLTGFAPTRGVLDYDLFYFDDSDLSWEAEDLVIRRCDQLFADLGAAVQARNQARVHLWYPEKHGIPYEPARSCAAAIDTFLARASAVGVRMDGNGRYHVYAPFGFDDLFAMIVRPNPRLDRPDVYYEKAARWKAVWPKLAILPWPDAKCANCEADHTNSGNVSWS